MCHYITLVIGGADEAKVREILRRHGRAANVVSNEVVASVLEAGERQYITTNSCDCGTALDNNKLPRLTVDSAEEVEKLRKQGWSEAKIRRWLEGKRKSEAKRDERSKQRAPDSLEYWLGILADLERDASPSSLGLLLHFYSGGVESESFRPERKEVRAGDFRAALASMPEDQLVIATP